MVRRAGWGLLVLALGTTALILVLSLLQPEDLPSTPSTILGIRSDLIAHTGMYFVLSALWALALLALGLAQKHRLAATIGASLLAALYGVVLEVAQRMVPGRSSSWDDAAANAIGAVLGASAVWVVAFVRPWRRDG